MKSRSYLLSFKTSDFPNCHRTVECPSWNNKEDEIVAELREEFKDDPNFALLSPVGFYQSLTPDLSDPTRPFMVDWELSSQMKVIREMTSLGLSVRGDAKVRVRQPLRRAYAFLSNERARNYIDYIDRKEWCREILQEELNVDCVSFVEDTSRFFDVKLKPNFKTLGPKGYGKQAQTLKKFLADLPADTAAQISKALANRETVQVQNVPLTSEDVETDYLPKTGYAGAVNKFGSIILDLNFDTHLLMRGLIADLQSEIQNLRKKMALDLTDQIDLVIYMPDLPKEFYTLLNNGWNKLKRDCMIQTLECRPAHHRHGYFANTVSAELDGYQFHLDLAKPQRTKWLPRERYVVETYPKSLRDSQAILRNVFDHIDRIDIYLRAQKKREPRLEFATIEDRDQKQTFYVPFF